MKNNYEGPIIEGLPDEFRDRVKNATEVARKYSFGVMVTDKTKAFPELTPDVLWPYGYFDEVFVFDGNILHKAHFKTSDDNVYTLRFIGSSTEIERREIEKALGADEEVLEVIPGFGHGPDISVGSFKYKCSPTGPYLGKRPSWYRAFSNTKN